MMILRRHWNSRAQLLPPYTTLDLCDFSYISVPAEAVSGRRIRQGSLAG